MDNKKVVDILNNLRKTAEESRDATRKRENVKAFNSEIFALKIAISDLNDFAKLKQIIVGHIKE